MMVPDDQVASTYLPLPLSVSHHSLEPSTSFISRLAAKNGTQTVTDFCRDIGFPYKSLISGDPKAIKLLAELAGCNANALLRISVRNLGQNALRLRDEIATTHTLKRYRVRICPACIRQDMAGNNEVWHAWRRITWQFLSVRSCAIHGHALIDLLAERHTFRGYDFSMQIRKHLSLLSEMEPIAQTHTEFEAYLCNRIAGLRGDTWLDRLELNVASRACEVFGLLIVRGAEAKLSGHNDIEWAEYGEAGYQIFRLGASAVERTLSELRRNTKADARFFSNVYGPFTTWLNGRGLGKEFEPLRNIVRRHILSGFRVRKGVLVLGQPSVGRGEVAAQVNNKKLEVFSNEFVALLVQRGLAHWDENGFVQANGFFTATMLTAIKREFDNLIDTLGAARFLGVSVDALKGYVEAGFLAKRIEPVSGGEFFDRGNLDWLMQSEALESPNFLSLMPKQSSITIPKPVSADDVAKRLKITRKTVIYLLRSGFLAEVDMCFDKRAGTLALCNFSISAFEFNFVSLGQLAADRGVRQGALAIKLRNLDVSCIATPPGFSRMFWRCDAQSPSFG